MFYKLVFCIDPEGITIEDISNTCKITKDDEAIERVCTATNQLEGNKIKFLYSVNICEGEKLIINYSYSKTKATREILYKQEPIGVPLILSAITCDYKFIIPEGSINLGLKNNLLTKDTDTSYIFQGPCPSEPIQDIIRYSPEEVLWKADIGVSVEYSPKFSKDVTFTIPRYYKGGKLNNTFYRILSLDKQNSYRDTNHIKDDLQLNITVPAVNKDKVGVEVHTAFINKLTDEFKVYFPESYYEIDSSNIDQAIVDKANEEKNKDPTKPAYYNIGKFVHDHIVYDINYVGRNLTIKQIYNGKKGVCEHYTRLYNAMLNAIGIKTLYVSGWSLDKNETSGDENTLTHAWTVALIGDKWIELDATWGLFEGVPAGHILKNFFDDTYSYSYPSSLTMDPIFGKIRTILVITDMKDMKDPFTEIEEEPEPERPEEKEGNDTKSDKASTNEKEKASNELENAEMNSKSCNLNNALALLTLFYICLLF